MSTPIDFYFDFSSPYGYFASQRIDGLAAKHNRDVVWHPYLMGAVFKITGRQPLVQHPLVDEYSARDITRTARLHDIPLKFPEKFPIASVAPCRAFYWLNDQSSGKAKQLATSIYEAYFADGQDISKPDTVTDVVVGLGIGRETIEAALQDQSVKDKVREETDKAIERKVFGSPYVIIDEEPFWGFDRFGQIERWLETGGW